MLDQTKLRALTDASLASRIEAMMILIRGLTFGETRKEFTDAMAAIGHFTQDQYEQMLDELCAERHRRRLPAWTPFKRAYVDPAQFGSPEALERFRVLADKAGMSMEQMRDVYLTTLDDEVYTNSRYQVAVRRTPADDGEGGVVEMVHISIKCLVPGYYGYDWRAFQRIKDELLGPNCEAIELFPAYDRVIDTADQWHLWGVNSGTFRWPCGWDQGRLVLEPHEVPREGSASQRPFE